MLTTRLTPGLPLLALAWFLAGSTSADNGTGAGVGADGISVAGKSRTLTHSAEFTHSIDLPPLDQSRSCKAVVELDYYQADTEARVTTYIDNRDCPGAKGVVHLSLQVAADGRAAETLDFEQSWSRLEAGEVELQKSYPLGENKVLLSVSAEAVTCECLTENTSAAADPQSRVTP